MRAKFFSVYNKFRFDITTEQIDRQTLHLTVFVRSQHLRIYQHKNVNKLQPAINENFAENENFHTPFLYIFIN